MSKNKYLGQIRVMLTVPLSHRILDGPGTAFAFQCSTGKTVCSNIDTDTIIKQHQMKYQLKAYNKILFLSNCNQNLVIVLLVS